MTIDVVSENKFPIIRLLERATPPTPPAGEVHLFPGTDKVLRWIDSDGTVTEAGGGVDDILGLLTSETDASLVLAPDGGGGVEFRAEAGGGGTGGHGARAYHSATQTVASSATVTLSLDSEQWDTDGFHSTTSRLTVPTGLAGKYLAIAATTWDTNGTGIRLLAVFKNGATVGGHQTHPADATLGPRMTCSVILDLADGDYVEAVIFQNSGSNRVLGATTIDTSTQLSLMRF